MRKLFVTKIQNPLVIEGDDHKHLSLVLRNKIGDNIVVCCGDGYDYIYEITAITKNNTILNQVSKTQNQSEPSISITLFYSVAKGDKNEIIVRTVTELGVLKIQPFISAFTAVKSETYKLDRMRRVALEASKQSGRGKLLEVLEPVSFDNILDKLSEFDLVVFPYEGNCNIDIQSFLHEKLSNKKPIKNIAIIVGGEGGFSEAEVLSLSGRGIIPVTLGKRILRADTACATVCALVFYEGGQMR